MKIGDIVSNGHLHNEQNEYRENILMEARVEAVAEDDVWVLALTGPHKGHRLTFKQKDLYIVR